MNPYNDFNFFTAPLPFSCDHNNPCHEHATCTDTTQGVSCTCNKGFSGNGYQCDGRYSVNMNRWIKRSIDKSTNESITYHANQFRTVLRFRIRLVSCRSVLYIFVYFIISDFDECFFEPCPTNNDCQNTPGSYNCTCLQPGACRGMFKLWLF
jgi:hypothetical protein